MMWMIQPIEEHNVLAFLAWSYDPPYDFYNFAPEEREAEVAYFQDPANGCHQVMDANGEFIAFCTFGPDGQVTGGDYQEEALDIGLGLRPDRTGQGLGRSIVQAVADFAIAHYAPVRLRATIAEFNLRSQRVWQQAGFQLRGRFLAETTGEPFLIFVADPPASVP